MRDFKSRKPLCIREPMKRKILYFIVFLFFTESVAFSGFRVLFCDIYCKEKDCWAKVLLDTQFINDLKSALAEGADYVLELEFKGLSKKLKFRRVISYDVIDRIYVIKDNTGVRQFVEPVWFYYRARSFSVPLNLSFNKIRDIKIMVRAVKRNPILPFPLNILPIGNYKTSWCECEFHNGR